MKTRLTACFLFLAVSLQAAQPAPEHIEDRLARELLEDLGFAAFFERLELDAPHRGTDHAGEIADARNSIRFSGAHGAPHGRSDHRFQPADREPHTDTGTLVDVRRPTKVMRELGVSEPDLAKICHGNAMRLMPNLSDARAAAK